MVTRGDCLRRNTLPRTQTKLANAPVAGTFGPSGPIEVRFSTCAAGALRTLVTLNTPAFLCSSAEVTKQESQTQAPRPTRQRKSVSRGCDAEPVRCAQGKLREASPQSLGAASRCLRTAEILHRPKSGAPQDDRWRVGALSPQHTPAPTYDFGLIAIGWHPNYHDPAPGAAFLENRPSLTGATS